MDIDLIPAALLGVLLKSGAIVAAVWQGVRSVADEAGLTLPKWAHSLGPRLLTLALYLVLAISAGAYTASDVAVGGLLALFAANLIYDATKGAVGKVLNSKI